VGRDERHPRRGEEGLCVCAPEGRADANGTHFKGLAGGENFFLVEGEYPSQIPSFFQILL
jgi:hypothetical protein